MKHFSAGLDDISDNCPNVNNVGQEDSDSDGVGDACDNCRDDANSIQVDADMNSYGDICDPLHNKDKYLTLCQIIKF